MATTNPTKAQIEALRSYLTSPNRGHGRIVGITYQLYNAGWLTIIWTGQKDWTLSINDKGRRVLEVVA